MYSKKSGEYTNYGFLIGREDFPSMAEEGALHFLSILIDVSVDPMKNWYSLTVCN